MNDTNKDTHYTTEGRKNALELTTKKIDKLILTSSGYDPKLSTEGNADYRHGMRVTHTSMAEDLDKRGYSINRVLFDRLMKSIDNVYYDEDERKKGLQINIRFIWQDVGNQAICAEALNRKNIKNVLYVRLAIFYKGIHAYDIEGNFATSKIK